MGDRVTDKRSIGTSPFKLVYGIEAIFPIQLILPVAKLFHEEEDEPNDMVRRMMDLVELQQIGDQVTGKLEAHQQRIKGMFDKRAKVDNSRLEIGSSSGILSDRTRENMENLTLCGLALL